MQTERTRKKYSKNAHAKLTKNVKLVKFPTLPILNTPGKKKHVFAYLLIQGNVYIPRITQIEQLNLKIAMIQTVVLELSPQINYVWMNFRRRNDEHIII